MSHMYIKNIEDGPCVPDFMMTLRLLSALNIPLSKFLDVIGYKEPKKGRGKNKCRWGSRTPHQIMINQGLTKQRESTHLPPAPP